jgi:hypothetical protein
LKDFYFSFKRAQDEATKELVGQVKTTISLESFFVFETQTKSIGVKNGTSLTVTDILATPYRNSPSGPD